MCEVWTNLLWIFVLRHIAFLDDDDDGGGGSGGGNG